MEPRDVRALTECTTVLPEGGDVFTVVGENGSIYGVDDAIAALLAYLAIRDVDVVALEALGQERAMLTDVRSCGQDLDAWLLPVVQERQETALASAGYRPVYVDPTHTTDACHECDLLAHVEDETITCITPDSPVGTVDRDRSAAVSIARRARGRVGGER